MRNIRNSVFETNSSSTHSICITTDRKSKLSYPQSLSFACRTFGWEIDRLYDCEDKAAYLYSSILSMYDGGEVEDIIDGITYQLSQVGVKCYFEKPHYYNYHGEYWCNNAGIDHAGEDDHRQFVDDILSDSDLLLSFLFSDDSFVITGNDNCNCNTDIDVDYSHKEYYKGN